MKVTSEQLADMAGDLIVGFNIYFNPKTLEFKPIPDLNNMMYIDENVWEEDIAIIENEWEDYISITPPSSREGYQFMEEFVYEVKDEVQRRDLEKILNRKSPFANFKAEVEYSDERQNWFDFRDKKYREYVRRFIEAEGIEVSECIVIILNSPFE